MSRKKRKVVMTRDDIIRAVARETSISRANVKKTLDAFADVILKNIKELKEDEDSVERITYMGFQHWEKKINKPRMTTISGDNVMSKGSIGGRLGFTDEFLRKLNEE